jgi:hypothetical protein
MTEATSEHTGRCLCGAVRYRAVGAPEWIANCHCASCRRATGAAMASYAGFATERFAYTAGAPVRFSSSPGVTRSFCGRCGTPLTYEGDRWPGEIHVLIGTPRPARGLRSNPRRLRRGEAALAAYPALSR